MPPPEFAAEAKHQKTTTTTLTPALTSPSTPPEPSPAKPPLPAATTMSSNTEASAQAPAPQAPAPQTPATQSPAARADKYKHFENEGVLFKAKLVGSELVMERGGDKMCQNSIQRLKAIIKGTNSHKKRIVLKVSFDGVKVYDEKTNEILHHHEVSQISFIAGDETDTRTFGYVSDVPSKAHQFICFKTSGPAAGVMSVISDLFEAVLERKSSKPAPPAKVDLIDSGIMDESVASDLFEVGSAKKNCALDADSLGAGAGFGYGFGDDSDAFSGRPQPQHRAAPSAARAFPSQLQAAARPIAAPLAPRSQPPGAGLLAPPSSLPKLPAHAALMSSRPPGANRSLVYNHSSVSLSDAALTRQSSFGGVSQAAAGSPGQQLNHSADASSADRYAVFNDIDNLPSIFESASLGSVNNVGVGSAGGSSSNVSNLLFASNNNSSMNPMMMPAGGGSFGAHGVGGAGGAFALDLINPSSSFGGSSSAMLMRSSTLNSPPHQMPMQMQHQHQVQQLHQQASNSAAAGAAPPREAFGLANRLPSPPPLQQRQQSPAASSAMSHSQMMFQQHQQQQHHHQHQHQQQQQQQQQQQFPQQPTVSATTQAGADPLSSSAAAIMFRQTNPFDDDFFN